MYEFMANDLFSTRVRCADVCLRRYARPNEKGITGASMWYSFTLLSYNSTAFDRILYKGVILQSHTCYHYQYANNEHNPGYQPPVNTNRSGGIVRRHLRNGRDIIYYGRFT